MNQVVIMGRLTRSPELKYSQSNVAVLPFTVAVDRKYKNDNGERGTDFIECVAVKQRAELISRYFTKGKMIAVVGSLQTRKYTDKDGNNRTATEVIVDEVNFCGDKSAENNGQAQGYSNPQQQSGYYEGYAPSYGGAGAAYNAPAPAQPVQSRLPDGFTEYNEDDLPF